LSNVERIGHPLTRSIPQLSSTTLRTWLDVSPVSPVTTIGHPLARSFVSNNSSRGLDAPPFVRRRAHGPSAHAVNLSVVVDDDQPAKAARPFLPELSKNLADETMPQPAFHQPNVIAASRGEETSG
jgi:hypothetical protein